jgi:hypothetical protein
MYGHAEALTDHVGQASPFRVGSLHVLERSSGQAHVRARLEDLGVIVMPPHRLSHKATDSSAGRKPLFKRRLAQIHGDVIGKFPGLSFKATTPDRNP